MAKDIAEQLENVAQVWRQQSVLYDSDADSFWSAMSPDDKLKAFYSVCKRIFKGDIEEQGTYRYVLYDVFNFGSEAYMIGMDSGYMSIHNLIHRGLLAEEEDRKELHERLSNQEQEASRTPLPKSGTETKGD